MTNNQETLGVIVEVPEENKAVRCFLMQYGTPGLTTGAMRAHMERCGFGNFPVLISELHETEHLTKADAQLWIRHLFFVYRDPTLKDPGMYTWSGTGVMCVCGQNDTEHKDGVCPSQVQTSTQKALSWSERELDLIDGMIESQLYHAERCDNIGNRVMAEKQKGWDLERVALLRKIRSLSPKQILEEAEERVVDLFCDMETPYLPDITAAIKAGLNDTSRVN